LKNPNQLSFCHLFAFSLTVNNFALGVKEYPNQKRRGFFTALELDFNLFYIREFYSKLDILGQKNNFPFFFTFIFPIITKLVLGYFD